jgi:hypothetical protein
MKFFRVREVLALAVVSGLRTVAELVTVPAALFRIPLAPIIRHQHLNHGLFRPQPAGNRVTVSD